MERGSPLYDLDRAASETRILQGQLQRIRTQSAAARARDLIDYVSRELEVKFSKFVDQYRKVTNELIAKEASVKQQIADTKNRVGQAKKDLAAMTKVGAAIPKMSQSEEADIDPKLGGELRDELLDLFGGPGDGEMSDDPTLGEIWEDWDWQQWENN